MDPTYISILLFLIITIIYYFVLKPTISVEKLMNPDQSILSGQKITAVIIYFLFIVSTQFFVNSVIIVNKCGGSVPKNIGVAGIMTLIPWSFIFGSIIVVLLLFPGFKSAFSNVVGYFAVAGSANKIINELLVNNDAVRIANGDPALVSTAEAVIKLFGDVSVLINQIVPENFISFWELLTPLMKPDLSIDKKEELKEELLKIVILRDNIGEGLWYFYTAILLISIVQYNITVKGCVPDPTEMAEKHQEFLDEEQTQLEQKNTTLYMT